MTYAAGRPSDTTRTWRRAGSPCSRARSYDFGIRPVAEKSGAIAGMGMTEKQGGSDVRANTTERSPPADGPLAGARPTG